MFGSFTRIRVFGTKRVFGCFSARFSALFKASFWWTNDSMTLVDGPHHNQQVSRIQSKSRSGFIGIWNRVIRHVTLEGHRLTNHKTLSLHMFTVFLLLHQSMVPPPPPLYRTPKSWRPNIVRLHPNNLNCFLSYFYFHFMLDQTNVKQTEKKQNAVN